MRFTTVVRNVAAPKNFARSTQSPPLNRLHIASSSNTGVYLPLAGGSFAPKFQEFLNFLKSNADLCGRQPEHIWGENKYLGFSLGRLNLSGFTSPPDSATSDVQLAEKILKNTVESIAYKTNKTPLHFKMGVLFARDSGKSLSLFPFKSGEDVSDKVLNMISKTVFIHFARAGLLARPQAAPATPILRIMSADDTQPIDLEALYAKPEFKNFVKPGHDINPTRTVFLELGEVEVNELVLVPFGGSPISLNWKDVDLSRTASSAQTE